MSSLLALNKVYFRDFSLQYADLSSLHCKLSRWLGISLIVASYNQQLLLTVDRVLAMRHFIWYRQRLMFNFFYPVMGTIVNFTVTILSYFPIFLFFEIDQSYNICIIEDKITQKFKLLFLGYGVIFTVTPLIMNVLLNAFVMRKLR